jgi:hypothetical protein
VIVDRIRYYSWNVCKTDWSWIFDARSGSLIGAWLSNYCPGSSECPRSSSDFQGGIDLGLPTGLLSAGYVPAKDCYPSSVCSLCDPPDTGCSL